MTDVQFYSALAGFLLPLLTAIVVQRNWSSNLKAIVNAALSLLAAIVVTYTQGDLDGDHLRQLFLSFIVVLVPSIAMYYGFYKPTEIAPSIEAATSPGSDDADRGSVR